MSIAVRLFVLGFAIVSVCSKLHEWSGVGRKQLPEHYLGEARLIEHRLLPPSHHFFSADYLGGVSL